MSAIEFERKVGLQITKNKRAEFTFPTGDRNEIEKHNVFPQQYEVIIGNQSFHWISQTASNQCIQRWAPFKQWRIEL